MRDHTSESSKKHMPTSKVISVNEGFNRAARRHDSSARMYIEEAERTGKSVPHNKPYVNKAK
jgi:hypothetical protein